MAALTGGAPSSVRAMAPILAAPAVWELEGPIITGPSISKISSIEKLLSECVEGIVPHNAARDNGFVDECKGNQGRTTVRPQARAPCDFVGDGGLDIPL